MLIDIHWYCAYTTLENARLAEDQSIHLHLCMLIHDLTLRYGPVVREGKVTGVLDAAFDVVIVSLPFLSPDVPMVKAEFVARVRT